MRVERTLLLARKKTISSSNQQLLARWLVPLLDRGSGYSFADLGLPLMEAQTLFTWHRALASRVLSTWGGAF